MYRASVSVATFVAATVFALPEVTAQSESEQVKQLEQTVDSLANELVDERAKLLQSLKVNDKVVDPLEVMREFVYLAGGKLVEAKVANFFILEEIMKQVNSGQRKADDFIVTDEEVMENLAPMQKEFEVKNPGIDFWTVVRTQYGLSRETFMEQRKESILFDRVFFPGGPKEWPEITKEAIKA